MKRQHTTDVVGLTGLALIAWGCAQYDPRIAGLVVGTVFLVGAVIASR